MKSIKYIVVLALIVLVALYYFKNNSTADAKTVKPINYVTLQASDSTDKTTDKKPENKQKSNPNIITDDFINNAVDESKIKKKDLELDYITAYRDWQYFENCYTDVEDFGNDKDPLDTLAERFESNPRESQNQPTAQQNTYYLHHVDICKTLIADVDGDTDDYYQLRSKLQTRFEDVIAKTAKEKQLQHALQMIQQLQNFQREISRAQYKKSTLTAEQRENINRQVQHFSNLIMEVYDGNDVLSEEHTGLIQQYSDEIDVLQSQINQSQTPDYELITQIENKIDGYLNSIDDYLHKVQSPDAFLVLVDKLYQSNYYQKDSTILKTLKTQTGIKDSYYINILNNIAMPLVACSMDYPCDADSDYILSYCLGLKDSMFNQACGSSLEDFYFNFYIGTNQLNDVNNYFSYLVNRYAN